MARMARWLADLADPVCSPYLVYLEALAICTIHLEFDLADIFSGHLKAQLLVLSSKLYLQYIVT